MVVFTLCYTFLSVSRCDKVREIRKVKLMLYVSHHSSFYINTKEHILNARTGYRYFSCRE